MRLANKFHHQRETFCDMKCCNMTLSNGTQKTGYIGYRPRLIKVKQTWSIGRLVDMSHMTM